MLAAAMATNGTNRPISGGTRCLYCRAYSYRGSYDRLQGSEVRSDTLATSLLSVRAVVVATVVAASPQPAT